MKPDSSKYLWQFRRAARISSWDIFILLILITIGIISVLNMAEWWFRGEHIVNYTLFILLSTFFWYGMIRIILIWINYLKITQPIKVPTPKKDLKVAIFTSAAPREPLSMFDKTFAALNNVSYPHNTYLLDSSDNPKIKNLALKYGIIWLDLRGIEGAKAGKVNRALSMTHEDFILILDPDHIVFPNFLDETLGFFNDPSVGFVQVSQGYYNQYRSFTATGAAQQTYTFYGPTQMGLFGFGCSVAIGANCTFRRKALESIGGHAVALAEDLVTSMRIHAAGWKSIYNPVIVSRGLVPEEFDTFAKQQLKWSRGVFEVLFEEYPKLYSKFSFWQKFSYGAIALYYFTGLTTLFFILIPLIYFFGGILPANMDFSEFIINGSYILINAILIYLYVQKFLCHPTIEKGIHWKGMVLKYALWPVYFFALILALMKYPIPYIPTEKKASIGKLSPFIRPLIWYNILFIIGVIVVYVNRRFFKPESELLFSATKTWGMVGFSFIAFILCTLGIILAFEAMRLKAENPWESIPINKIRVDNLDS